MLKKFQYDSEQLMNFEACKNNTSFICDLFHPLQPMRTTYRYQQYRWELDSGNSGANRNFCHKYVYARTESHHLISFSKLEQCAA